MAVEVLHRLKLEHSRIGRSMERTVLDVVLESLFCTTELGD